MDLQSRQTAFRQKTNRCLWCVSSPVSLEVSLDRSSYCCGQQIKVQCEVQNGSDQAVTLICRLVQVSANRYRYTNWCSSTTTCQIRDSRRVAMVDCRSGRRIIIMVSNIRGALTLSFFIYTLYV